jgi:hypothetical protein
MLRFPLRHPAVTAAVAGARSPADASYLTLDIPDGLFTALAGA